MYFGSFSVLLWISKEFYRLIRTKQRYLDFIKKGQKTLEVRVGYEHIKTIQPGESVKFCSRVEALITIVKAIRKYSTIEEMLEYEEAGRIIPNLSKSEVLKILREIYPVDLEKLGIIVLEIEKK